MIWGVSSLGWWFQEAAAMFFGVAIIIMFLSGLSVVLTSIFLLKNKMD